MTPEINSIYQGDCVEIMRSWPENSVDAVVTDPPYGIRFMGKAWDGQDIDRQARERMGQKPAKAKDGRVRPNPRQCRSEAAGTYNLAPEAMQNFQEWTKAWAREALRILKPGGHLLSFASTRTYHRMACGIENAGFEVRDKIQWIYGSGFPKSLDVSKAIDKTAGYWRGRAGAVVIEEQVAKGKEYERTPKGAAVTAAAAAWDGWGTALKPANEPVCMARKPLSEPTIAANVLKWGTGALNIDACRIEATDDQLQEKYDSVQKDGPRANSIYGQDDRDRAGAQPHEAGRWPANVLFDRYAAGFLDAKEVDASRFFYVAKPDRGERDQGCDDLDKRPGGLRSNTSGQHITRRDGREPGPVANFHPTVKPIDLMSYLIQLVTPRGGVVLDPFTGSGTTGIAAVRLGHPFLGCELSADYIRLAEKRIAPEIAQGKIL